MSVSITVYKWPVCHAFIMIYNDFCQEQGFKNCTTKITGYMTSIYWQFCSIKHYLLLWSGMGVGMCFIIFRHSQLIKAAASGSAMWLNNIWRWPKFWAIDARKMYIPNAKMTVGLEQDNMLSFFISKNLLPMKSPVAFVFKLLIKWLWHHCTTTSVTIHAE